jgi:hypothetical protein
VNFIAQTKRNVAMMSFSLFVYSFASGRLERTIVTVPIAFTIAGTAGLSFKIQI